jgi:LPS O-antigen subunit length determinant protein (WzzB/FepE family)
MRLNNFTNIVGIASIVAILLFAVSKCTSDVTVEPIQTANLTKVDSLQNVIDSLQIEIEIQNKGFDSKEHRYEDVLFEYEFGIDYLEKYHPEAYRDFHRIIGFKERFRREDEQENKKRLHVEKY